MMRCSVIIPTYNRSASLRETLKALRGQTLSLSEFEVIVVSDGSTDDTERVLQEFAQEAGYMLRWSTQRNSGPAAARNRGVAEAQSDVIVFIDDDVEPVPECLERHLSHHAGGSDGIVVLGPLSPNPRYEKQEPVWIAWEHAKLQSVYNLFRPGGLYQGCAAGYMHFYSGNASLRRQWLLEAGGFNTEFRRQEDVELAERLARQCGVTFQFDFDADGLHHPSRTLRSWLGIPSAYGQLDAERVRAGTLDGADVAREAASRNRWTRGVVSLCIRFPVLLESMSLLLSYPAALAYRMGHRGLAFSALSAAYNARYTAAYERARRDW